jgi:hypothetical protein
MATHDHFVSCPHCAEELTCATNADDEAAAPNNGDFTICIRCGEWGVFEEAAPGGLRKPSEGEYLEIGERPDLRQLRAAYIAMDEERRANAGQA